MIVYRIDSARALVPGVFYLLLQLGNKQILVGWYVCDCDGILTRRFQKWIAVSALTAVVLSASTGYAKTWSCELLKNVWIGWKEKKNEMGWLGVFLALFRWTSAVSASGRNLRTSVSSRLVFTFFFFWVPIFRPRIADCLHCIRLEGYFVFSLSKYLRYFRFKTTLHLTWTSSLNSTGEFVRFSCFKSFDVHDSFPCSALGKIDLIPWEKKGAKRKKQIKSTNGRTVKLGFKGRIAGDPPMGKNLFLI